MSERIVVYSGTRNVYPQMYTSLKSLLRNNQVDMVFLFLEDDDFPYPLPKIVRPFNVSGQPLFKEGNPNYSKPWSYMEMLRSALGRMMIDEIEQVLWLDVDTIIDADISELFNIDMTGYFYAGVMEPKKSNGFFHYINTGVCLCNLKLIRQWHKEDEMIAFLETYEFAFPGQDVLNLLCQGRIKLIDSEFNSNAFTAPCHRPKIIHYAAVNPDNYKQHWAYRKYELKEIPGLEDEDD